MARAVLLLVFAVLASLGAALGDGCWLDCDQADADGAAAICASEGGALCSPYEMLADEATRSTSECDMFDYAWTDDDSFTWSSESLSWSCGAGERLACVSNGHPASTDCACYDESTQLDVRCCNCDGNDDAMAACLRCVNEECEGNEPHSEICSDCFGEDCDECGDAVGESERESFVRGGCDFDDGSEVGNWFRDEACGSLRGCEDEEERRYEPCDSNDDCEGECKFCYVDEDGEGHCELCYYLWRCNMIPWDDDCDEFHEGTCAYHNDQNEELEARQNCEAVCETGGEKTCTTSYYRSDDEVASKEVAREYCGADGLARIDSFEQNVNALSQCDMAVCWLDLQEVNHGGRATVTHNGTWVWSDGSTPAYLNWDSQSGEPHDWEHDKADAVMNSGDVRGGVYEGTWFDAPNYAQSAWFDAWDLDWPHALCNNNNNNNKPGDCADDIYLAPYMTGCPEGYDFPATEGACQRAADLSSGYEYGGAEGPYAEDHPPCFWDGDEEELCWTRPARGYCPQVSEEWGDLGAVCVRVGGCFETMGCQGGTPRPTITPAPTPSPASCTVRAYEIAGCTCNPKSTCEGGMHDGSDEPCCGTNGGYCGVEWRGTDGAEWIDIHDDACSGTDFFRVSPGCGIEVKTDSGDQNGDMRAYTYNEGSVLVCGYECECRATPGCDTVRYLRIFATGPAAYDQGDEDECEGDEDDDDDWDEDEDEDCDIETSDDRSSSPSGTTNHGAGNGWCYSDLDEHVGCAASPGDCWAMCLGYYGDGLVAIDWGDGGDCYCQHDCECMEDVGDIGTYLITRDTRVGALPNECGPDEGEGEDEDEDWMWENGCRPDYCTSWDEDCCASMNWGEPATCANGYSPWPPSPGDDCQYTCCPASASGSFVYVDQAKSFDDARAYCRANYHDLASIHSSTENAAVAALCQEYMCWIGGSDAAQEGTWTWSDGTAWDYENWEDGEPNNDEGDEPYAVIYPRGGRWNDDSRWGSYAFVCSISGQALGRGKDDGPDAASTSTIIASVAAAVALVLIGGLGILYLKIQRLQRQDAPLVAHVEMATVEQMPPPSYVGKGQPSAPTPPPGRNFCIDCGAALRGPFCGECGRRQPSALPAEETSEGWQPSALPAEETSEGWQPSALPAEETSEGYQPPALPAEETSEGTHV